MTQYSFMSKTKLINIDSLSFQEINEDAEYIPLLSAEDEKAMSTEDLPD